jgi:hypothetical protein
MVAEDKYIKSHVRMKFNSLKEATKFYKLFAKTEGFVIRILSRKPKLLHFSRC